MVISLIAIIWGIGSISYSILIKEQADKNISDSERKVEAKTEKEISSDETTKTKKENTTDKTTKTKKETKKTDKNKKTEKKKSK